MDKFSPFQATLKERYENFFFYLGSFEIKGVPFEGELENLVGNSWEVRRQKKSFRSSLLIKDIGATSSANIFNLSKRQDEMTSYYTNAYNRRYSGLKRVQANLWEILRVWYRIVNEIL